MNVAILNRQRKHPVPEASLKAFVERLAGAAPATPCDGVTILFCGDVAMRRLNARFRGKDRSTDVLSFPSGGATLPDGRRPLGEIAVAMPQAARQARDAGHSLARELRILVVHGYLHLLGYDHEVDDGTMLRLQSRLTRRLLADVR